MVVMLSAGRLPLSLQGRVSSRPSVACNWGGLCRVSWVLVRCSLPVTKLGLGLGCGNMVTVAVRGQDGGGRQRGLAVKPEADVPPPGDPEWGASDMYPMVLSPSRQKGCHSLLTETLVPPAPA